MRNAERQVKVLRGLEQAARVLEAVSEHPMGMTLTELASHLGLAKATAYRTASTWRALGYLRQLEQGSYALGPRPFELAMAFASTVDYRLVAHPFLVDLNRSTGETVHLAILDSREVLYLDKVEGRQPIRVYTAIGARGPLHATASGKAMAAHMPEDHIARLRLEAFTTHTITSPIAFRKALQDIRRAGYALNRGEWHEEVAGVGVPVFRHDGVCIAALSITFPSVYLTDEKAGVLATHLIPAAAELSGRLGHVASGADARAEKATTA